MKLALFKRLEGGWTAVCEEVMEGNNMYLRLSEFVDVDFPPRKDTEAAVKDEIAKLDSVIEGIKQMALEQIESINIRKAELLALTHE